MQTSASLLDRDGLKHRTWHKVEIWADGMEVPLMTNEGVRTVDSKKKWKREHKEPITQRDQEEIYNIRNGGTG